MRCSCLGILSWHVRRASPQLQCWVVAKTLRLALRRLGGPCFMLGRLSSKVQNRVPLTRLPATHWSSMSMWASTTAADEPPRLATRLHGFSRPTVWTEFTPLAQETGAVNLGQGFPDWSTPEFVVECLARAAREGHNQYTRPGGHPALVETLAKRYSKSLGRDLNPLTQVAVCVGASEALFACFQSLVNPGDEVVVLEPAFDIYTAQIKVAGGVSKFVPMRTRAGEDGKEEYYVDIDEFEAAFSDKTRVVLLNYPQNPTGKVFTVPELEAMSDVIKKHDKVTVVADEVYEYLTYEGKEHVSIATIPGMFDRTAVVSSAGKTFSCTGWKTGWVVGPEELVKGIVVANQWVMFSAPTVTQQALAFAMEAAAEPYESFPNYYEWLNAEYSRKRGILVEALEEAGLKPIAPEGSFFVMGNTSDVEIPEQYFAPTPACPVMTRDWAFCRYLTLEHGVAAIPPSSFYSAEHAHLAANFARFAFCKKDESLHEAARRLKTAFAKK